MEASKAWERIRRAIMCSGSESILLDGFQKLIRRRFRKKGYKSFRVPEYEGILLQDKHYTILYIPPPENPVPFRGWDEWRLILKKFQRRCIHNYTEEFAQYNYGSLHLQIQTVSEQ